MNEQEELSDAIINFQVKHHVNDETVKSFV